MIFNKRYFLMIVSVITLLRVLYIWQGPIDLSPDEAHYWEWSKRLDLSYYSKGPMIAYIIAVFTKIGGDNEVSVRAGAVIISAVCSLILYVLTRDIFKSERAGFFAGLLPSITPLYAVGSIFMTTDAPLILFWGLSIYFFRKALHTGKGIYWYTTGIFTGLGLLSKYSMVLIFPCVLLYLIFSREDRFWLRRKEPYIASLISMILFTPVIIWNSLHDWVTVRHTLGQAHAGEGFRISIKYGMEFLGSQAGILTPFIFFILMWSVLKAGTIGFKEKKRDYMLLFFTSLPVFLFFFLKSLQGKVQANWAATAYFTSFAAIGICDGIYTQIHGNFKKWLWGGFALACAIGLIAVIFTHFPALLRSMGMKRIEAKAPYNRVIGWEEMGEKAGDVYRSMAGNNDRFILSDTYQMTSELAFYVPGNPAAYNINLGSRRMNQYDIWGGLNDMKGRDAVYVTGDKVLNPLIQNAFDVCEGEPTFKVYRGGIPVREFSIYRCSNFKGMAEKDVLSY